MNIKPFGNMNPNKLNEYYAGEIKLNKKAVEFDLNFSSETIDPAALKPVETMLSNLKSLSDQTFAIIGDDFDKGDDSQTAMEYLVHHQQVLPDDEVKRLLGTGAVKKERFLKALAIHRIGFYPEDESSFIVVDVGLPELLTDYVIALTFDVKNKLRAISIEN